MNPKLTDEALIQKLREAYEQSGGLTTIYECAVELGLSKTPHTNESPGDAERMVLRLVSSGRVRYVPRGTMMVAEFVR